MIRSRVAAVPIASCATITGEREANMRKIILTFSFLFILTGIMIGVMSHSLEQLMPKIGFAAYQLAAAGSYTPQNYELDLSANYGWSAFCIFIGILGIVGLLYEKQLRDWFMGFIGNKK